MTEGRYYWLKLSADFFRSLEVKKLRRLPKGDTCVVIYLRLLLLALDKDGMLFYSGVEDDFYEEMALLLDESPEDVTATVDFLIARGILCPQGGDAYEMVTCAAMTGSESNAARRVRKSRQTSKQSMPDQEVLHCNTDVTPCNADVTPCNAGETKCNTEIEKELETEIESETELESEPEPELKTKSETKPKSQPEQHSEREQNREQRRQALTAAPPARKENRNFYGEYQNVLLSDTEIEKLRQEFPEGYLGYIERLSDYMVTKGTSYRSHYATIRKWLREDGQKAQKKSPPSGLETGSFVPSTAEQEAVEKLRRFREELKNA